MAQPPRARPSAVDATPGWWQVRLSAAGPSSLAARRWPVLVVLTNVDARPHSCEPQGVEQVRLRSPALGLSLCCETHAAPGPRVKVEPGGELRLPLDLLEHVQDKGRLAPGPFRVGLRLRDERGPLLVPATTLVLGP